MGGGEEVSTTMQGFKYTIKKTADGRGPNIKDYSGSPQKGEVGVGSAFYIMQGSLGRVLSCKGTQ